MGGIWPLRKQRRCCRDVGSEKEVGGRDGVRGGARGGGKGKRGGGRGKRGERNRLS